MNEISSSKCNFETVWASIQEHTGEEFFTLKGLSLFYEIKGEYFIPSRTEYRISKKDFEKAYHVKDLVKTTQIKECRRASYILAVLTDRRIVDGKI